MDLAGTVESVGPQVEGFKPGDEVYGFTGGIGSLQGSLAEFAAVDRGWWIVPGSALANGFWSREALVAWGT